MKRIPFNFAPQTDHILSPHPVEVILFGIRPTGGRLVSGPYIQHISFVKEILHPDLEAVINLPYLEIFVKPQIHIAGGGQTFGIRYWILS